MVVYDRRPQGALPAITDILDSVSNSFLNDTNSGRFKILKRFDHTHNGNTIAGVGTDSTCVEVDWFYSFPDKYAHTLYKALGTGAIADIDEGAIYIVTVAPMLLASRLAPSLLVSVFATTMNLDNKHLFYITLSTT